MSQEYKDECTIKVPLFDLKTVAVFNEGWKLSIPDLAICEKENAKPVAFCSKRYAIVQPRTMLHTISDKLGPHSGSVLYHQGYVRSHVWLEGDEYKLDDGGQVGLLVVNSVNKESALSIRFLIKTADGPMIQVPGLKALRRVHIGKQLEIEMADYVGLITTIKGSWKTIVTKFKDYPVDVDTFDGLTAQLDCDPRVLAKAKEMALQSYFANAWDLIVYLWGQMDLKTYKSDLHKDKRLAAFTQSIYLIELGVNLADGQ